ncbi:unnamed protein product [Pleuronectes platessa]|uniref:Uncharacterized protein n=1 Tax=Pleuronectes platessa TaxID=8262 RepID=A0A9N7YN59_PLEPL|nr:unnamed protein product [Pleuronectes platessa]
MGDIEFPLQYNGLGCITRGRGVEGKYVPLRECLPHHKMAAGSATSPRMHHSGRFQCVSPLIKPGAQNAAGAPGHAARGNLPGGNFTEAMKPES